MNANGAKRRHSAVCSKLIESRDTPVQMCNCACTALIHTSRGPIKFIEYIQKMFVDPGPLRHFWLEIDGRENIKKCMPSPFIQKRKLMDKKPRVLTTANFIDEFLSTIPLFIGDNNEYTHVDIHLTFANKRLGLVGTVQLCVNNKVLEPQKPIKLNILLSAAGKMLLILSSKQTLQ